MNSHLILLYDNDCPFCTWYSNQFIRFHLLSESGRIPFIDFKQSNEIQVNMELAKNKIACINTQTTEITYGINSLLLILGQRFKWIERFGKLPPVHFLLTQLYAFISYNRKIIAPSQKKAVECNCEPSISFFWRAAFIAVFTLLTYLIVTPFFNDYLVSYLVNNPANDFLLLILQLTIQAITFNLFKQKNLYDYLGHVAFVSFLGALIVLFLQYSFQLLTFWGIDCTLLIPTSYGMVLLFMFFEHKRRLQLRDWSPLLSVSWILFRVCIYPLVFKI